MKPLQLFFGAAILLFFTQCNTEKNLPTNTSGGLFSLNGQWQLTSSGVTKNMEGTVITVLPGFSEATVRSLPPVNSSCVRERDALWRKIKSNPNGGFLADVLISACTGSPQYKQAAISIIGNDEIRVNTTLSSEPEMQQTWKRLSGGE